jgi:hypothetical protein
LVSCAGCCGGSACSTCSGTSLLVSGVLSLPVVFWGLGWFEVALLLRWWLGGYRHPTGAGGGYLCSVFACSCLPCLLLAFCWLAAVRTGVRFFSVGLCYEKYFCLGTWSVVGEACSAAVCVSLSRILGLAWCLCASVGLLVLSARAVLCHLCSCQCHYLGKH